MNRAMKVPVPKGVAALDTLDAVHYQDAYSVRTSLRRTPEQWARLVLEGGPGLLQTSLRGMFNTLGFRLGSPGSADHVLGWEIQHNGPEDIVLGIASPIGVTALMVVIAPLGQVVLVTRFRFDNRLIRPIWALFTPLHRITARYLLKRSADLADSQRTGTSTISPR
jgi:hypothetical protein